MREYQVKELIDRETIERRIAEVAKEIERDYAGKNPIMAVVLKGGFVFAADLLRSIDTPFTVDFIGASSYEGTQSTGDIKITKDLDNPITGRHIILVEDIVDSGLTLYNLGEVLRKRGALSVKIATLLIKKIDRPFPLDVDYFGFEIPDEFVVGWGLDYNERHRGLPFVGYVEFTED
ncbi:MAG TPA: hypoxanthine phosphoribosyltransferase [candidate division Zixibacteria bacterium]|nr:hypoxanthine phosphoribosyltransferase [candidate division Zixibacteria bacterium]